MKFLGFLKLLLTDPTDPVRHCDVYKTSGCAHVDGFLCDMPTCDILQAHRTQFDSAQAGKGEK